MTKKYITLKTRWPAAVVSEDKKTIEIEVPMGNGHPVLNQEFEKAMQLSAHEKDAAVDAVLRAIAIES